MLELTFIQNVLLYLSVRSTRHFKSFFYINIYQGLFNVSHAVFRKIQEVGLQTRYKLFLNFITPQNATSSAYLPHQHVVHTLESIKAQVPHEQWRRQQAFTGGGGATRLEWGPTCAAISTQTWTPVKNLTNIFQILCMISLC